MSVTATPGAAAVETGRPRKPALSDRTRAERRLAFILVAPAIIVMIAVTVYPIINAFILSLQRADLRFPAANQFIGFDNYGSVLSSPLWWQDVLHTVIITFFSVSIELVIGMLVALAMHRVIFARGAVRAIALIPYGIVTVVAAYAWRYAFELDSGWIPGLFGIHSDPLAGTTGSYVAVIISEIWKTTPFMALLLLGGLALVPGELHEAAVLEDHDPADEAGDPGGAAVPHPGRVPDLRHGGDLQRRGPQHRDPLGALRQPAAQPPEPGAGVDGLGTAVRDGGDHRLRLHQGVRRQRQPDGR
jgi:multiple sugar transport system permease protein